MIYDKEPSHWAIAVVRCSILRSMPAPLGTLSGSRMVESESTWVHDVRQFFLERQHLVLHEVAEHDHNHPLPCFRASNTSLCLLAGRIGDTFDHSSCVHHGRCRFFTQVAFGCSPSSSSLVIVGQVLLLHTDSQLLCIFHLSFDNFHQTIIMLCDLHFLMVCQNSNPLFCASPKSLHCALVSISICKVFVQVRLLRVEESEHCCYHSIDCCKEACLPSFSQSDCS